LAQRVRSGRFDSGFPSVPDAKARSARSVLRKCVESATAQRLCAPVPASDAMDDLQFGDNGRLRHLITLEGFDAARIHALLDRADAMRADSRGGTRPLDLLSGRTLINLFFEPSTRTRTSFDLAAQRLGAQVINFDIARSS